jgi:aminotransferase
VFVPLLEEESFSLDVEAIGRAVTPQTRIIYLCSPSNPTGSVFPEADLRRLAEIALERDLIVLTDEAYEYFVYDGRGHFSIASIPELRGNAVSCFTFTKTYAMTGWRVGYLHADESLIARISKAHIPLALCAPVVSQYAALEALRGPQDCVEQFRMKYLAARDLLCRRLDGLAGVFSYQRPAGSYLMFPRIVSEEGRDSTAFALRLLREAGVSFTPGVEFGPSGEGHLRVSFCVPEEQIALAFDRLKRYFGE